MEKYEKYEKSFFHSKLSMLKIVSSAYTLEAQMREMRRLLSADQTEADKKPPAAAQILECV